MKSSAGSEKVAENGGRQAVQEIEMQAEENAADLVVQQQETPEREPAPAVCVYLPSAGTDQAGKCSEPRCKMQYPPGRRNAAVHSTSTQVQECKTVCRQQRQ